MLRMYESIIHVYTDKISIYTKPTTEPMLDDANKSIDLIYIYAWSLNQSTWKAFFIGFVILGIYLKINLVMGTSHLAFTRGPLFNWQYMVYFLKIIRIGVGEYCGIFTLPLKVTSARLSIL